VRLLAVDHRFVTPNPYPNQIQTFCLFTAADFKVGAGVANDKMLNVPNARKAEQV